MPPAGPATSDASELLDSLRARLVGLETVEAPVLVACSGGADSLALLAVAADRDLDPVALHVDHGLRADSARDVAVVAGAAAALGTGFHGVDVRVERGPNLEARARTARYAALEVERARLGATAVLVGHTADDQAETVLLNLLRGSASAGLGAMAPRRGAIVRPLLGVRHAETVALCDRLGLVPLHDPMNDDPAFRRVWIRNEVLPLLAQGAGRDLVPILARQADILREESDYLDGLARAAWPPGRDDAPTGTLARLLVVLARRALRCWLGSPPPTFDEVDRVLAVARGQAVGTELSGGRRVARARGQLHLSLPEPTAVAIPVSTESE